MTLAHATPSERYYGFDHVDDEFASRIAVLWPLLGMDAFGPRTSVDGAMAPYGNSHQRITSAHQDAPHTSVISNKIAPAADGTPVFLPVWQYMLTH